MARHNLQTKDNKIKLLTEYECVNEYGNAVLAAMMFGRKYDAVPQNGDCS
jgi:hypothetical protein